MTAPRKRRGIAPPAAPAPVAPQAPQWGRLSPAVADMAQDVAERAAERYRDNPRYARFHVEARQAGSGLWFIAGKPKGEPS